MIRDGIDCPASLRDDLTGRRWRSDSANGCDLTGKRVTASVGSAATAVVTTQRKRRPDRWTDSSTGVAAERGCR